MDVRASGCRDQRRSIERAILLSQRIRSSEQLLCMPAVYMIMSLHLVMHVCAFEYSSAFVCYTKGNYADCLNEGGINHSHHRDHVQQLCEQ